MPTFLQMFIKIQTFTVMVFLCGCTGTQHTMCGDQEQLWLELEDVAYDQQFFGRGISTLSDLWFIGGYRNIRTTINKQKRLIIVPCPNGMLGPIIKLRIKMKPIAGSDCFKYDIRATTCAPLIPIENRVVEYEKEIIQQIIEKHKTGVSPPKPSKCGSNDIQE